MREEWCSFYLLVWESHICNAIQRTTRATSRRRQFPRENMQFSSHFVREHGSPRVAVTASPTKGMHDPISTHAELSLAFVAICTRSNQVRFRWIPFLEYRCCYSRILLLHRSIEITTNLKTKSKQTYTLQIFLTLYTSTSTSQQCYPREQSRNSIKAEFVRNYWA